MQLTKDNQIKPIIVWNVATSSCLFVQRTP